MKVIDVPTGCGLTRLALRAVSASGADVDDPPEDEPPEEEPPDDEPPEDDPEAVPVIANVIDRT